MTSGVYQRRSIEERFWARVDRSGGPDACWPWVGFIAPNGYGRFWLRGKNIGAHSFAFQLLAGVSISGVECACHKCDNRRCCNPAHIFLGDRAANNRDASMKGRLPTGDAHHARRRPDRLARGENHGCAKLTESAVIEIHTALRRGDSQTSIAKSYGVTSATIGYIAKGKRWRHLCT